MNGNDQNRAAVFIVLLVLLAGGVFAFYVLQGGDEGSVEEGDVEEVAVPATPAADAGPAPEPATEPAPQPAPQAEITRPDDEEIRKQAGKLSDYDTFRQWLATEHMLPKFVAVVVAVSSGRSPRKLLRFMEPEGRFAIEERGEQVFIDPASYRRYDLVARAFGSLDAKGCARLLHRYDPWLEQKYREMGDPDRSFRQALEQAIIELLEVPVVEEDIPLGLEKVMYRIGIEELEAMSEAQKHLFRMGPANIRVVQAKLRAIGRALGMGDELAGVEPIAWSKSEGD